MGNECNYEKLFGFPSNQSEMFFHIMEFFSGHEFSQLSPHLNWFVAECIYHFGEERTLSFLHDYSSTRVQLQTIEEYFHGDMQFLYIVEKNLTSNDYIELQSMSSFMDGLRRYAALLATQHGASVEKVAHDCGTNRRFVQRLKRAFQVS